MRRMSSPSRSTSRPATWTEPLVFASRVVMIRMTVVFPAPLGPRKPKNSPSPTEKLTSLTALVSSWPRPPYTLTRCWTSMTESFDARDIAAFFLASGRKVMGMKVTRRGRMSHGGIWVELKSPDSEQRLELNWYPTDSKFFTRYRKGEELDHLAFRVRDVNQAFREIVASGAHPEVEPFKEDRYEFAFASDPDGIWIELIGRIKASTPD